MIEDVKNRVDDILKDPEVQKKLSSLKPKVASDFKQLVEKLELDPTFLGYITKPENSSYPSVSRLAALTERLGLLEENTAQLYFKLLEKELDLNPNVKEDFLRVVTSNDFFNFIHELNNKSSLGAVNKYLQLLAENSADKAKFEKLTNFEKLAKELFNGETEVIKDENNRWVEVPRSLAEIISVTTFAMPENMSPSQFAENPMSVFNDYYKSLNTEIANVKKDDVSKVNADILLFFYEANLYNQLLSGEEQEQLKQMLESINQQVDDRAKELGIGARKVNLNFTEEHEKKIANWVAAEQAREEEAYTELVSLFQELMLQHGINFVPDDLHKQRHTALKNILRERSNKKEPLPTAANTLVPTS